MFEKYYGYYLSPIGLLEIICTNSGIISCNFVDSKKLPDSQLPLMSKTLQQLDEYFTSRRKKFDLELNLFGTDFQKKVWNALLEIPFGEVITYKDLAKKIGNEKAVRAVGNANGKNPISVIVPCHRVIGSNGSLVGYGGGLKRKKWLLDFEKKKN
ncbi:MAG: methylated-DNA--[protein]-cysteine S-methyltransferase [Asgard group archaeon]|nr:methylated-DNA--[protein]-cysteine S-methyltransferase [Asgard group archaeon]